MIVQVAIQKRVACRLFHQWILNSTGLIMKVAGFVTQKRAGRGGEGKIQVTFRCDAASQLYITFQRAQTIILWSGLPPQS